MILGLRAKDSRGMEKEMEGTHVGFRVISLPMLVVQFLCFTSLQPKL